jgi:DUF4097 and DUF4098 domain-containing protein YvlB
VEGKMRLRISLRWKIFLSAFALSALFFSISFYSFEKEMQQDPEVVDKIHAVITKKFDLDNVHFSFSKSIATKYVKTNDSWKLDLPAEKILVNAIAGDVEILAGKEDKLIVKVSGQLAENSENKLLDIQADKTTLKIKEWTNDTTREIRIKVYLPKNYRQSLEVQTVSGDIDIQKNYLHQIKVESVSGDVDIAGNSVSEIKIETVSGDSNIAFARQHDPFQFKIKSLSGEISNSVKADEHGNKMVSVETVSGNVKID